MNDKNNRGKIFIITGMSGAGKSSVLKMLEDDGYFCVDNLPAQFLLPYVKEERENSRGSNVAIVIDIRNEKGLEILESNLPELKESGAKIVFLEASNDSLIIRYKETRRLHPLLREGRVQEAIEKEREKLAWIKKFSDYIIDSSRMLTRELRMELNQLLVKEDTYSNFVVTLLSFGFKYGIPTDADLVFDVRFLPNPYYVSELREQTGNDKPVYDFVMKTELAEHFLVKLIDLLSFLIPNYMEEGKTNLVVAIGCTGGKHRSVTLANALMEWFRSTSYSARIEHREI